jgi:hypothetical protein
LGTGSREPKKNIELCPRVDLYVLTLTRKEIEMQTGESITMLLNKYQALLDETAIVKEELLKHIKHWQSLADLGFVPEAVTLYRRQHKCSLKEAYDIVQAFRNQA